MRSQLPAVPLPAPLPVLVLALALGFGAGCKKPSCDRLVGLACEHLAIRDNDESVEACDRLKEEAKLMADDECLTTLHKLTDSGKIQAGESR